MKNRKQTRAQAPTAFSQAVGAQATRKLKAQRNAGQGVWFGLGMMGLIGWSVVVPTLLGAALGIWLDNRHPGSYSWTLMLLAHRPGHRLFECLALGGQGRRGNTCGTRRSGGSE